MSTYQQFLAVVNGLSIGTKFEVTFEWCTAQGLTCNADLVKSWGSQFADDYRKYNVKYLGTTSNNLRHYEK